MNLSRALGAFGMRRLKVMTLSMMHKDHSLKLPQSIQKPPLRICAVLVNANYWTKLVFILGGGVEGGKKWRVAR